MFFGDSETAQDCADKVGELWTFLEGFMVTDCAWYVDTFVPTVNPTTGEITSAETVTGPTGQGTSASEILPPSQQMLLRWGTGYYVSGRELRGRTFVPALTINVADEGQVLSTAWTSTSSYLTTWLAAGPPLLIWSRAHGVSMVANTASVWQQFAVLRSRRD